MIMPIMKRVFPEELTGQKVGPKRRYHGHRIERSFVFPSEGETNTD
jgi:hypothetical protein